MVNIHVDSLSLLWQHQKLFWKVAMSVLTLTIFIGPWFSSDFVQSTVFYAERIYHPISLTYYNRFKVCHLLLQTPFYMVQGERGAMMQGNQRQVWEQTPLLTLYSQQGAASQLRNLVNFLERKTFSKSLCLTLMFHWPMKLRFLLHDIISALWCTLWCFLGFVFFLVMWRIYCA